MRLRYVWSIYRKEMLDLARDRRTVVSMVIVPVLVFPLIMFVATRVVGGIRDRAEREAKTLVVGLKVANPGARAALASARIKTADRADLESAIASKAIIAGVEERTTTGKPPQFRVYSDNSNPTSSAAADRVRAALDAWKERSVRERLKVSGVSEEVLTPFEVSKINVAPPKKMAGMMWGSMLGYLLLLLMFSGGMYPVIDMTAGEKERRTLESFLATPAGRNEIVTGKMLAAMSAILLTAVLTLVSIVTSIHFNRSTGKSDQVNEIFSTIPLDAGTLALLLVTLVPVCILSAAVMIAIAMFARSFKEGQSYLTPLMLFVLFPAMMGGLPQLELTPALCLIPIFNASQLIRSILLGEFSSSAFGVTLAANLAYAGLALFVAKRRFENETVLFRS